MVAITRNSPIYLKAFELSGSSLAKNSICFNNWGCWRQNGINSLIPSLHSTCSTCFSLELVSPSWSATDKLSRASWIFCTQASASSLEVAANCLPPNLPLEGGVSSNWRPFFFTSLRKLLPRPLPLSTVLMTFTLYPDRWKACLAFGSLSRP